MNKVDKIMYKALALLAKQVVKPVTKKEIDKNFTPELLQTLMDCDFIGLNGKIPWLKKKGMDELRKLEFANFNEWIILFSILSFIISLVALSFSIFLG